MTKNVLILQAYNILSPTNPVSQPESVLINVGNEYAFAEALISLSLHQNLEVFVIVDSDDDAILFATIFPKVCGIIFLISEVNEVVKGLN